MKTKTKKIIAFVLLIAITCGTTTTAFAMPISNDTYTTVDQTKATATTSEHEVIVSDSETRGKITIGLKALKTLIANNKDTIKDILVGLNIIQEPGFDNFYDKFMYALDLVFDTNDTIEGVFTDALVSLKVPESIASVAAMALTHFFF